MGVTAVNASPSYAKLTKPLKSPTVRPVPWSLNYSVDLLCICGFLRKQGLCGHTESGFMCLPAPLLPPSALTLD